MPLHASDLLNPKGRLDAEALWPGKDLSVVSSWIDEYLTEGYGEASDITDVTSKDEAARQWAYYRAWDGVYQRLLLMPSTVSTSDEGSSSYLLTQMEHVGELSQEAYNLFLGLVSASAASAGTVLNRASETRPLVTTW